MHFDSTHYLDVCGNINEHVMLQYWFDGPIVPIAIKPHGNSHSSQPYFRTAESARKRHKEILASKLPKEALYLATQECGGELEAKGMCAQPRNIQQLRNYRRSGESKQYAV